MDFWFENEPSGNPNAIFVLGARAKNNETCEAVKEAWVRKAAISIGLAFRKVNINNKNVTGSPKSEVQGD
jgi:hypothetical protein